MRSRARGLTAETLALIVIVACHRTTLNSSPTATDDAALPIASASAVPSASASATKVNHKPAAEFSNDAQGEAERGYAQVLANQPTDALETLHNAATLGPSPLLLSQISFNIGLAHEKLGNAELARAAFARAHAAHASDAAKAKLAGKSMCTASIVKEPLVTSGDAGTASYVVTRSWRDVWKFAAALGSNLVATIHDWTIVPRRRRSNRTSDARARELVCTDTSNRDAGASLCVGAGPWAINVGHLMFRDSYVHVLADTSGLMLVIDGGMDGGGCTGMGARPASSSSVSAHGSVLELDQTVEWWNDDNCKTQKPPLTERSSVFYDLGTRTLTTVSAATTLVGRTMTIAAPSCTPVSLDP